MTTAISLFTRRATPELPMCPIPLVNDAIMAAVRDLCDEADLITDTVTFTSVIGTRKYALSLPFGFKLSRVTSVRTTNYPRGLGITSQQEADQVVQNNIPRNYYVDGLNKVCLVSTPSVAEAVSVSVVLKPELTATDLGDVFYDTHLDTVMAGTKARLMLMPGKPWTNFELGSAYETRFRNDLVAARITTVTGNAGGLLTVRPRKFGGLPTARAHELWG